MHACPIFDTLQRVCRYHQVVNRDPLIDRWGRELRVQLEMKPLVFKSMTRGLQVRPVSYTQVGQFGVPCRSGTGRGGPPLAVQHSDSFQQWQCIEVYAQICQKIVGECSTTVKVECNNQWHQYRSLLNAISR